MLQFYRFLSVLSVFLFIVFIPLVLLLLLSWWLFFRRVFPVGFTKDNERLETILGGNFGLFGVVLVQRQHEEPGGDIHLLTGQNQSLVAKTHLESWLFGVDAPKAPHGWQRWFLESCRVGVVVVGGGCVIVGVLLLFLLFLCSRCSWWW